jgi:hypothetical protein
MLYQLPNGKVIYLTIDQFLELTDLDIQYFMSIDGGDYAPNPFTDSAVVQNSKEHYYDFDYLVDDDSYDKSIDDDIPFDEIIDLGNTLED